MQDHTEKEGNIYS